MSTEPRQPRSRRDRPAKPPLSRDAIVDAALAILRDDGLHALSMRRVAAALDTGPASLYVYFPSRKALHDAMVDRAAGGLVPEVPDPARWREQLRDLVVGLVRAFGEHPGIAQLTMARIPTSETTLAVAENALAILRAGDIEEQTAAWAVDLLSLYATAVAYEESVYQARAAAGEDVEAIMEEVHQVFTALPPDRFPNTLALLDQLVAGDGEQRFAFGLDVLIAGLEVVSARARAADG